MRPAIRDEYMPELPEVETIIRDLKSKIFDLKIKNVEILLPRIVKSKVSEFKNKLIGSRFVKIERVGKLMILYLNRSEKVL